MGLARSGIRGGGGDPNSGTRTDWCFGHRSHWGCSRPEHGTSWRSDSFVLDRQIMQEAEVTTPPRKEANGHGGRRAPESQLPS